MQLAKSDYIQAAVMLHPSFVTVDEMKGIYDLRTILLLCFYFRTVCVCLSEQTHLKIYWNILFETVFTLLTEVQVPIAILGAEVDKYCPPDLLKQFEEVLSSKSKVLRA